MLSRMRLNRAPLGALWLTTVLLGPALASTDPVHRNTALETTSLRFDTFKDETQLTGRITHNLCYALTLPERWEFGGGEGGQTHIRSTSDNADLQVSIRSARDLQHMPQGDLPSRDAAFLQRDYEDTLGQPAQAVSLSEIAPGAIRWTATWIDGNLPSESHALTVETFIVPLSTDWVLELSLDNVPRRESYNTLTRQLLASVSVKSDCAQGG